MYKRHQTVILERKQITNIDTGAILKGSSRGYRRLKVFLDDLNVLKIGAGENNDLMINDPTVSSTHCMILRNKENNYSILDLHSKNGTFVNGICVKEATLRNGDKIKLGNAEFTFSCGGFELDKSVSDFIERPAKTNKIASYFKKMTWGVATLSTIAFALSVCLLVGMFI